MGDPLRAFKPPAPQQPQFLASKLHEYATQQSTQNILSETTTPISEIDPFSSKMERKPSIKTEERSVVKPVIDDIDREAEMDIDTETKPKTESVPLFSDFVLNPDLEETEEMSTTSDEDSE